MTKKTIVDISKVSPMLKCTLLAHGFVPDSQLEKIHQSPWNGPLVVEGQHDLVMMRHDVWKRIDTESTE